MDALQQLKAAIATTPDDPALYYDLGGLHLASKQYNEAIKAYQIALKLAPNHPQILLQLGNCYSALHQHQNAVEAFTQSALAEPSNAAFYNLGNAQRALGQTQAAVVSFQQAIQYNTQDPDAYNNLGNALRELGALDEAIAAYQQAVKLNPKLYHAQVHLVHQKQHICDWQKLTQEVQQIRDWVNQVPQAQVSPFAFLAMPNTTAEEQLKCSSNWLSNKYSNMNNINIIKNKKQPSKKKIAYLSSDFRLHPLAFLITELIELHDRNQFEVIAYTYGLDDHSAERLRLSKAFDHFIDTQHLSIETTARDIATREVDILIDLTGYTQTSRSGIAALRPAKVHVNWLGFPGSMGRFSQTDAPLFDYLISDEIITPVGTENAYAEKIIKLPCYQPNNITRPIGNTPSRKVLGLADNAFVYCCFNQSFKITPDLFAVWMRILRSVPNSVLWLLECNRWAKENLQNEAKQHGVDTQRIVFAPRVSIADHLARHVHADVFLDTNPYNAHTTCSDALYMGLPVITLAGNTFASRVANSLLTYCGLPELVTTDVLSYEQLAIRLAKDKTALASIKQKLAQPQSLPLFNTTSFVKKLEQAYLDMLE